MDINKESMEKEIVLDDKINENKDVDNSYVSLNEVMPNSLQEETVEVEKEKINNTAVSPSPNPTSAKPINSIFKYLLCAGCLILCVMAIFAKVMPSHIQQSNKNQDNNQTPPISFNSTNDEMSIPTAPLQLLDVSGIVYKSMPAMVSITCLNTPHTFDFNKEIQNQEWNKRNEELSNASGVIIGSNNTELLILTNAHVINEAKSIVTTFCDNTRTLCYVKGASEQNDVALLAVKFSDISKETANKISILPIGNSKNVVLGQGIVAIGNALGNGQSVTTGIISGINRKITLHEKHPVDTLQIDAAINPGNSGGALLNANGELIGIPTAKSNAPNTEGVGFAIPVDGIKEIVQQFSTQKSRCYATDENAVTIGISIEDTLNGIMIVDIVPNSIAFSSDLQVGDIIMKLNDKEINGSQFLVTAIKYFEKGETIKLTVNRPSNKEYKIKTIEVVLK